MSISKKFSLWFKKYKWIVNEDVINFVVGFFCGDVFMLIWWKINIVVYI